MGLGGSQDIELPTLQCAASQKRLRNPGVIRKDDITDTKSEIALKLDTRTYTFPNRILSRRRSRTLCLLAPGLAERLSIESELIKLYDDLIDACHKTFDGFIWK